MDSENGRKRRLLAPKRGAVAAVAGALAGLASPGLATAGTWTYSGFVGPSHHNNACDWYASLGVCGWNYWNYEAGTVFKRNCKLLVGFEDPSAIRGHYYFSGATSTSFSWTYFSFGFPSEYLAAQATYFAGPQSGELSITAFT